MRVKNINGTSDNLCKCSSWLEHCNKYGGNIWHKCSVKGCNNLAEVGAHVIKVNGDKNWYIVPFCKKHNQSKEELILDYFATLAPAAVDKTCGR